MTMHKTARLLAILVLPALTLGACATPPPPQQIPNTSASATSAKTTEVAPGTGRARAPTGVYRTAPRYRSYSRGPYWRYGVGGAVGGVIVGAAIEREIIDREIEDAVIDDALGPDPDFGVGGDDWGGGDDFGGGDWGDDW